MDRSHAAIVALLVVSLLAGGTGVGATGVDETTSGAVASPEPAGADRSCPAAVPETPDASPGSTVAPPSNDSSPKLVELYPNPTTDGNVGEYAVLEVPPNATTANWTLTDGHTEAEVPDVSAPGRIALTLDPEVTADLTDHPVRELEGHLRLAADGDELALRNGTGPIDVVAYDRAPQGERWYRTDDVEHDDAPNAEAPADGAWHPRGATCLSPTVAAVDEATAFVLPDAPEIPRETIRDADDRLLLAGYTITSADVADELVAAADRGVDVAVLLEAGPVGGTPRASEAVLETLEDGDVDVRAIGGEGARYRYHHPKYAVADDRVLVATENWKPSGLGGEGSRGWGVSLEDASLAADLAAVFRADHEGRDTESGASFREHATFVDDDDGPTDPSAYPTDHQPETVPVESAELLVAPDNADRRLAALLERADDELLVKQPTVGDDFDLLDEAVDAARRGVDVRLLLDSAWYHADDNEALAADLERLAADESIPLEVDLVDDTDRFEKIHAKGVVIDREVAVVGSANWNENAFENNREVMLALHGEAVATYYADVFDDDWEAGTGPWTLPFGLGVTVVVALAGAALVGRRYVRFGEPRRVE